MISTTILRPEHNMTRIRPTPTLGELGRWMLHGTAVTSHRAVQEEAAQTTFRRRSWC